MNSEQQAEPRAFRSYEDVRDEILGRYSVADLVEQTDEDLRRGDELFYKGGDEMKIIAQGTARGISVWTVQSGGDIYYCRRVKNFVWCSCRDFFFRKKVCKHIALTTGVLCEKCGELRASEGKLCVPCDQTTRF